MEKYNLKADLILEPESKNTCAAIYMAAKLCENKELLIIMPSDHLIQNNKTLSEHFAVISNNIREDYWVTLGIKPTKPSDAYGYILSEYTGKKLNIVHKFIEKPQKKVASQFINDSNYFWNAGIFFASSNTIINSVIKHAPDIAISCDKTFDKILINKKTNEYNFPVKLFSQIPSKSIDYAVMEKEKNIYLYPFKEKWSDVNHGIQYQKPQKLKKQTEM